MIRFWSSVGSRTESGKIHGSEVRGENGSGDKSAVAALQKGAVILARVVRERQGLFFLETGSGSTMTARSSARLPIGSEVSLEVTSPPGKKGEPAVVRLLRPEASAGSQNLIRVLAKESLLLRGIARAVMDNWPDTATVKQPVMSENRLVGGPGAIRSDNSPGGDRAVSTAPDLSKTDGTSTAQKRLLSLFSFSASPSPKEIASLAKRVQGMFRLLENAGGDPLFPRESLLKGADGSVKVSRETPVQTDVTGREGSSKNGTGLRGRVDGAASQTGTRLAGPDHSEIINRPANRGVFAPLPDNKQGSDQPGNHGAPLKGGMSRQMAHGVNLHRIGQARPDAGAGGGSGLSVRSGNGAGIITSLDPVASNRAFETGFTVPAGLDRVWQQGPFIIRAGSMDGFAGQNGVSRQELMGDGGQHVQRDAGSGVEPDARVSPEVIGKDNEPVSSKERRVASSLDHVVERKGVITEQKESPSSSSDRTVPAAGGNRPDLFGEPAVSRLMHMVESMANLQSMARDGLGLGILLLPLLFQDGTGAGAMAYYEEEGGSCDDQGQVSVRHLSFELEMSALGLFKIDVVHNHGGIEMELGVRQERCPLVRKELARLLDRLQSLGLRCSSVQVYALEKCGAEPLIGTAGNMEDAATGSGLDIIA